jgi:hypothetical protein
MALKNLKAMRYFVKNKKGEDPFSPDIQLFM